MLSPLAQKPLNAFNRCAAESTTARITRKESGRSSRNGNRSSKVGRANRFVSRRDFMIVARYAVPGIRLRKDRVPEGQNDSSQVRSAWNPSEKRSRPGGTER